VLCTGSKRHGERSAPGFLSDAHVWEHKHSSLSGFKDIVGDSAAARAGGGTHARGEERGGTRIQRRGGGDRCHHIFRDTGMMRAKLGGEAGGRDMTGN